MKPKVTTIEELLVEFRKDPAYRRREAFCRVWYWPVIQFARLRGFIKRLLG